MIYFLNSKEAPLKELYYLSGEEIIENYGEEVFTYTYEVKPEGLIKIYKGDEDDLVIELVIDEEKDISEFYCFCLMFSISSYEQSLNLVLEYLQSEGIKYKTKHDIIYLNENKRFGFNLMFMLDPSYYPKFQKSARN